MSQVAHRPTADQVAAAAVAACRQTGENVFEMMAGARGSRARFYCVLALSLEVPSVKRHRLAGLFGFAGENPDKFYKNACERTKRPTSKLYAKWWSTEILERVRAAIRKATVIELELPRIAPEIDFPKVHAPSEIIPPAEVTKSAPPPISGFASCSDVGIGFSKRARLEAELRRAVQNTK